MKFRKWKPKNILDKYRCDNNRVMHRSHSCSFLVYHFSITPKYRRKIFSDRTIIKDMGMHIKQICNNLKFPIHKLSIELDHVHLELQLPPNVSPTKAMQYIKGISSRFIRKDHPEFRWSDGYWVGTVGKANKDIIDKYIENQGVNFV